DAVVDVDHAPVAVEPLPVRTPITGRASVVDVDKREASTRPVLVLKRIGRTAAACRTAVAVDHQRRLLTGGRDEVPVAWRIVEGVRGHPVFGGELDGLRCAEIAAVDVRRVADLDHLLRPRVAVDGQN